MTGDLGRLDTIQFIYNEQVRIPEVWNRPEGWDPTWIVRLKVNFDENEDVLERMVGVYTQDGRLIMSEFQSRSNPTDLIEEYPDEVDSVVFQCQIVLAEELRGRNLAMPFWVMSELILIDTDPKKQRLIIDLSANGWTQRRMPEYYQTLKQYFPNLAKIFEYNEDGVYFVIYDFDKKD